MGDDSGSSPYKSSFTLTAAKLDLTDPLNAKLAGVYLYVGKLPAQSGRAWQLGTAISCTSSGGCHANRQCGTQAVLLGAALPRAGLF